MTAALALFASSCAAPGVPAMVTPSSGSIPQLTIHPPYAADYSCTEHWVSQLQFPGDALGTDCYVTRLVANPDGSAFVRAFQNNGLENADWFSWGAPVLAPIDGTVVRVVHKPGPENRPGKTARPPAGTVVFENANGIRVLIAHLGSITVEKGEVIKAGTPFAVVANNGVSRSPHVHIGAWKGTTPYQIRHDLRAMADLRNR